MEVINQIQLPPALQEYPLSTFVIAIFAVLAVMAILVSLSAFIASAPKSGIFRAFFAVILHIALTIAVILVLVNLKEPPDEEVMLIIAFISAMVAFSTCFTTSIVKGAGITLAAGILYFLVYKCLILFIQSQHPDIYQQYAETVSDLLSQYQLYRY